MLKEVINSLVPENIANVQLIKDTLDVFLEVLVEKSDIAIDIKNIFDRDKTVIYNEFIKIYLNSIYEVFNNAEYNEVVYNKLKVIYQDQGLDINNIGMSIDIHKFLTEDYIYTNKAYKSAKGTEKSIEYIYNMVIDSGIQGEILEREFNLVEQGLFQFKVTGSLIPEIYEQFVKPLSHPIGWAYAYEQIIRLFFTDYFNIKYTYDFSYFEMRTKFGDLYHIDNYLTNLDSDGNPLLGNNTVKVINTEIYGSNIITTIYFESGEKLISTTNPISNILYTENNTIIKNYDLLGNSALYIDYTLTDETSTEDSISFMESQYMMCQPSDLIVCGAGTLYCNYFTLGNIHNYQETNVKYQATAGNKFNSTSGAPAEVGDFIVGPIFGAIGYEDFEIQYVVGGIPIDEGITYIGS